jgi:hypothetical protein
MGSRTSPARSKIEALCDLEMLCNDQGNLKHLQLATARGTAKTRRAWLRRSSPDTDPARFARVTAELTESETQICELKANGAIRLTIDDKFERAPKAARFEAFYNDFCTSTHDDLSALSARHLRDDHLRIGANLDVRDITVAKRVQVAYTCGWNPIRAPRVDQCQFYVRGTPVSSAAISVSICVMK